MNLMDAEDVNFESTLIPMGTVVKCNVTVGDSRKSQAGNEYADITLEVIEGPYTGSKFFDQIGLVGSDGFVKMGRAKMKYILETTRAAHLKGKEAYEINSIKELSGGTAIVKTKIDTYTDKDGNGRYKNVAAGYGSPRPESSGHAIYAAFAGNEQPWQTDEKPPLPTRAAPHVANSNNLHPNHPDYGAVAL